MNAAVATSPAEWLAAAAEILQDTDESDVVVAMRALRDAINKVGAVRLVAALRDAADFAHDMASESGEPTARNSRQRLDSFGAFIESALETIITE